MLLVSILTADIEHTRRDALVYYVIRENDAAQQTDSAVAYAAAVRLGASLRDEIDGCWELDHSMWDAAVAHLGPSRLAAVTAKVLNETDTPAVPKARLILSTFRLNSALPVDITGDGAYQLELIVRATALTDGVCTAWDLARSVIDAAPNKESAADTLYGALFSHCFSPPNAVALRGLLALPLTSSEADRLEHFALSPSGAKHQAAAVAVDILLVKLIGQGKYVDAIRLDRRAAQHEASHAFDVSPTLRLRRKTLLDGAWSILPAIQRNALLTEDGRQEDEMETRAPEKATEPATQPQVQGAAASPSRPLPMSASLRSTKTSSPDMRLLRQSLRASSDAQPRANSAGRLGAPQAESPALRSSSPFAGWKRHGENVARDMPRNATPMWGSPVPKITTMDTSAMDEIIADVANLERQNEPEANENIPEREPEMEPDVDTPMDEPEEPKPRPRRAPRRAAQRASTAIRRVATGTDQDSAPVEDAGATEERHQYLQHDEAQDIEVDNDAGDVSIPGGFPEAPRRRTRHSLSHSASMHATSDRPMQPMTRSTTQSSVTYPTGSLTRLEALQDSTPIARRTRSARAELDSRGSQASADMDESDIEPTPSRRSRRTTRKTPRTRSKRHT